MLPLPSLGDIYASSVGGLELHRMHTTLEMARQTPCPSTLLSPDICGHALRYSMAAGETHTHTHVSALASSFFNCSWMWVWQKILVTIRFLNTQQPEISSNTQWIWSILDIARLCCIVKLHCSLGSADATWAQSTTYAPPPPHTMQPETSGRIPDLWREEQCFGFVVAFTLRILFSSPEEI